MHPDCPLCEEERRGGTRARERARCDVIPLVNEGLAMRPKASAAAAEWARKKKEQQERAAELRAARGPARDVPPLSAGANFQELALKFQLPLPGVCLCRPRALSQ